MSKSNQELNLLLCSVNLSTLLKDVSETLVLTHLMIKILMRHEWLVHGKGNENRSSSWDVYCYHRNRMEDFSIFSSEYLTVSYSYSDFYKGTLDRSQQRAHLKENHIARKSSKGGGINISVRISTPSSLGNYNGEVAIEFYVV